MKMGTPKGSVRAKNLSTSLTRLLSCPFTAKQLHDDGNDS